MCLAIPGKVVELKKNGKIAIVDYGFEKREVDNSFAKAKPGDWVLVQFKMVVEKLCEKDAKETIKALKEASQANN